MPDDSNEKQEWIKALKSALFSGVETVVYRDRRVTYRSLDDLKKALDMAEAEAGINRYRRRYGEFSRGR